MMREDGRGAEDIRKIRITKSFMKNAHGSALIEWGNTRVLCTAMYTASVPAFLEGTGMGWLTAEYAMLPASTPQRKPRELKYPDGRSTEIGRFIGRALRSVCDLNYLEDSRAEADMNVVMSHSGGIIEVQCTGEKRPLARREFDKLLRFAGTAIANISAIQKGVLEQGV